MKLVPSGLPESVRHHAHGVLGDRFDRVLPRLWGRQHGDSRLARGPRTAWSLVANRRSALLKALRYARPVRLATAPCVGPFLLMLGDDRPRRRALPMTACFKTPSLRPISAADMRPQSLRSRAVRVAGQRGALCRLL